MEKMKSIEKLFENLESVHIPLGMLAQFLPVQYAKVRDGVLDMNPRNLAEDCVVHLIEDYNYATMPDYKIGDAFAY